MDTQPTAWQPLGTHLVRVVDDVLFLQTRGTLELSDMHEITRLGGSLISRYGYHITIVDGKLGTAMTAEARRYNTQWMRDHPDSLGCSVVYGANAVARAIVTMIIRATTILTKRPSTVSFVEDEAAALVWVARERLRLVAELALRQPPR